MDSLVHNCVKDISSDDAERKRPIPHESAVDVQVAVAQTVSVPQVPDGLNHRTEAETSRFFQRNARRRWRMVEGNGEFCARETGEKFLRPVGEYDPKSRERWGAAALNPQPLTEKVVAKRRTELREDLSSDSPERSETLDRIYYWLAVYMELPQEERERLEGGGEQSVMGQEGDDVL